MIFKYLLSALLVFAGTMHFVQEKFFLKAMPPYIPYPKAAVIVSGIAEIAFGVGLLFEPTRSLAAWGIIALLVAVFPANIYMATSGRFSKIPSWALWLRLPLQFVLIWWVYQYV
ncbi:MAG: DoxX family protein [Spirosomataceae bacterium]